MNEAMKQEVSSSDTSVKKGIRGFMKKSIPLSLALLITFNSVLGAVLIQHYFYKAQINTLLSYGEGLGNASEVQAQRLEEAVIPEGGVVLPVKWGDIGNQLVDLGVIDQEKFLSLLKQGPLSGRNSSYEKILSADYDESIVLTQENSRFVLNTLWALGLAQQSSVLSTMQSEYPQVDRLAATGGWTLAEGGAMEHYGKHNLLNLSDTQQDMVMEIASNIYRPCCNNHTAFADCNHGMAMLGLIEMMVAGGSSEDEIYESALAVNSVWFPSTYLTLAKYMEDKQGIAWEEVNAKGLLGAEFSSGSGYRTILASVNPVQGSGGGSCGV